MIYIFIAQILSISQEYIDTPLFIKTRKNQTIVFSDKKFIIDDNAIPDKNNTFYLQKSKRHLDLYKLEIDNYEMCFENEKIIKCQKGNEWLIKPENDFYKIIAFDNEKLIFDDLCLSIRHKKLVLDKCDVTKDNQLFKFETLDKDEFIFKRNLEDKKKKVDDDLNEFNKIKLSKFIETSKKVKGKKENKANVLENKKKDKDESKHKNKKLKNSDKKSHENGNKKQPKNEKLKDTSIGHRTSKLKHKLSKNNKSTNGNNKNNLSFTPKQALKNKDKESTYVNNNSFGSKEKVRDEDISTRPIKNNDESLDQERKNFEQKNRLEIAKEIEKEKFENIKEFLTSSNEHTNNSMLSYIKSPNTDYITSYAEPKDLSNKNEDNKTNSDKKSESIAKKIASHKKSKAKLSEEENVKKEVEPLKNKKNSSSVFDPMNKLLKNMFGLNDSQMKLKQNNIFPEPVYVYGHNHIDDSDSSEIYHEAEILQKPSRERCCNKQRNPVDRKVDEQITKNNYKLCGNKDKL